MLEDLPHCPHCGHNVWIRSKKRGKEWDETTRKSKTLYHYYVGCNTCFMRGPLAHSEDEAVEAYEKLIRRIS